MSEYTFQLIMLAGAYVLAGLLGLALVTATVLNYRYSKSVSSRLAARRSVETRLTTLEAQQESLKDLVMTFNARWSKRARAAKRDASSDGSEAAETGELDRDALHAEWLARKQA